MAFENLHDDEFTTILGPDDLMTEAQTRRVVAAVAVGKAKQQALRNGEVSVEQLQSQIWLVEIDPHQPGVS